MASDFKQLHVIIKDQGKKNEGCGLAIPVGSSLKQLYDAVQEAALGPEDDRWTKISEERVENLHPVNGGGTIDIISVHKSRRLHLFTHPDEASCPVLSIPADELPPSIDLHRLLLRHEFPEPRPLTSEQDVRQWWSSMPRPRSAELRTHLLKRLIDKMSVGKYLLSKAPSSSGSKASSPGPGERRSPSGSRTISPSPGERRPVQPFLEAVEEEKSPRVRLEGERQQGEAGQREGDEAELDEEGKRLREEVASLVKAAEQPLAPEPTEEEARDSVAERMMLEGVQGVWELSCDRHHAARVSLEVLDALMSSLRCGTSSVQVVALAAVWNLAIVSDVRGALIQMGIIKLLPEVIQVHTKWLSGLRQQTQQDAAAAAAAAPASVDRGPQLGARQEHLPPSPGEEGDDVLQLQPLAHHELTREQAEQLQLRNRVVFHALAALAVLAVDGAARARWIQMSPGLDLLVALCSLDFPVPSQQPSVPAARGGSRRSSSEAEQAEPLSHDPVADDPMEEGLRQQSGKGGADANAAGSWVVEQAAESPASEVSEVASVEQAEEVAEEDVPYMHQKMAAEVLYSMLARDGRVREAYAAAGGMASQVQLLQSRNPDVRYCAVMILAAYAGDVGPDHTSGMYQLRVSGHTTVLIDALLLIEEEMLVVMKDWGGAGGGDGAAAAGMVAGMAGEEQGVQGAAVAAGALRAVGGGTHPLSSLQEAAALALRACVVAQVVSVPGDPGGMLSLQEVSRIARLAEMLGQQMRGVLTAAVGGPPAEPTSDVLDLYTTRRMTEASGVSAAASDHTASSDQGSGGDAAASECDGESVSEEAKESALLLVSSKLTSQAATLYCLLSCLVTVHTGPHFLATFCEKLRTLMARIEEEEKTVDIKLEELNVLRTLNSKRRSSTTTNSMFDDGKSEALGPVEAVECAERNVDLSRAELTDLQDDLQVASEDCVAALLEALNLPLLQREHHPVLAKAVGTQLAYVQLMAVGLAQNMASAAHPSEEQLPSLENPGPLFQGPFRQLLLDNNVVAAVAAVALPLSKSCEDATLIRDVFLVASSAIAHLAAVPMALPAADLTVMVQFMVEVVGQPECAPHLASALWCLARHEDNRRVLLKSVHWLNLCTFWSDMVVASLQDSAAPASPSGAAAAAAASAPPPGPGAPLLRCCIMAAWLLLKQWLLDHASPVNALQVSAADALYARSETSWWALRFDLDTPLGAYPPLGQPGSAVGGGLAMVLHLAAQAANKGMPRGLPLWDMALRCCWSLAAAHPELSGHLIALGANRLVVHYCTSRKAASPLVCTAVKYLTFLMDSADGMAALGGATRACKVLVVVLDRALHLGDAAGRGADIEMMDLAVRGLARVALKGPEGMQALIDAGGVRRLIEVVRADNRALEAVTATRLEHGIPLYESPHELLCPLRAINGMPHRLGPSQMDSAAAMEAKRPPPPPPAPEPELAHSCSMLPQSSMRLSAEGARRTSQSQPGSQPSAPAPAPAPRPSLEVPGSCSGSDAEDGQGAGGFDSREAGSAGDGSEGMQGGQEEVADSGDADVGLTALWGILNLSGYTPAQVRVCRFGLYTLLGTVHRSCDPQRTSTAAAILNNIHFHPSNVTTLYRAELRLKQAALIQLECIDRQRNKVHVGRPPSTHQRVNYANPSASKVSPQTLTLVRTQISSSVEAAAQLGADLDRDHPERRAAEANVAFLKCLVDPNTFAMGLNTRDSHFLAADRVSQAGSSRNQEVAALTADLMERLTADPEEARYLAHLRAVSAVDGFSDSRHNQGSFLRAFLSRSLAEGPQSLWGGRAAAEGRTGALTAAPLCGGDEDIRPGTAPAATRPGSARPPQKTEKQARGGKPPAAAKRPPSASRSSPFKAAPSPHAAGSPGLASAASKSAKAASDLSATNSKLLRGSPKDAGWLASGASSPKRATSAGPMSPMLQRQVQDGQGVRFGEQPRPCSPQPATKSSAAGAANRARSAGPAASPHGFAPPPAPAPNRKIKEPPKPLQAGGPWAPHILSYIQDQSFTKVRTPLARKLLTVGLPVPTAEGLAQVSSSLLQSQALGPASSKLGLPPVPEGDDGDEEDDFVVNVDDPCDESEGDEEVGAVSQRFEERQRQQQHQEQQVSQGRRQASAQGPRGQSADPHSSVPAATCPMSAQSGGRPASARTQGSFVAGSLISTGALSTLDLGVEPLRPPSGSGNKGGANRLSSAGGSRQRNAGGNRHSSAGQQRSSDGPGLLMGAEVVNALRRPSTAYQRPHQGSIIPEAPTPRPITAPKRKPSASVVIRALHERSKVEAAAASLGEDPPLLSNKLLAMSGLSLVPTFVSETVPRPTTVVAATLPDLLALRQLREAEVIWTAAQAAEGSGDGSAAGADKEGIVNELEAAIQALHKKLGKTAPLALVVATGDGGPEKIYKFPRDLPTRAHHLCLFEHVEGCRVCEELYGHYLLPSGRLAHFYVGDTVRKGHRVDLIQPPEVPYDVREWLPDGLPGNGTLMDVARHMGLTTGLTAPLWCPVPELGPETAPGTHILEWEQGREGRSLQLRTVQLVAEVEWVRRQEVATEVVEPKPRKTGKKKKPPTMGR